MPSDMNDHDLLIQLSTKVDMLILTQSDFIKSFGQQNIALVERVTALENKDSRDSEKVQAIRADVQRSLDNASKVESLKNDVVALQTTQKEQSDEINRLRSKANLWDSINSIGIVLSGVLGYFFGK